ncbi:TetR/AcrR family transcriptional regulator [Roseibium porphyridii]|uniref:TetR/AcrR family transcriptional regulator n=1 Tax=Roseibium porphyridii TaxID=2866279 RepID=A0ABY8F4R8_9HYPH|nr:MULTISPECIES: TetR/AcrR family transcriptional regulator [Stappiaceae]QFT32964.1 HTH-type transcriptional regulator TtgR [Labrenzia sp. THAF82]WFE88265.1 TetR/AcrR family transcriptional regulator [Roseibium sp. KMA01]
MAAIETRRQIIEAADDLFYSAGFGQTSFADIAKAVNISRGNFYYHFKTKDEILDAVIDKRLADRETLLAKWDETADDPVQRIICFIRIVIVNQSKIMAYGCPVGTMTAELAKLDHPSSGRANKIMALFRNWLQRQFDVLGCGEEAEAHALHVLGWSQGVASLAQAFGDDAYVRREVEQITHWLKGVAAATSRISTTN